MTAKKTPTNVSHIFVCLNAGCEKQPSRSSVSNPVFYRPVSKRAVGRGSSPKVRVSSCVSMGLCGALPEGVAYFQRYLNVSCDEPTALLSAVDGILKSISAN